MTHLRNENRIITESSSKGNQIKFMQDDFWYKLDTLGYEALAENIISEILKLNQIESTIYECKSVSYTDELGYKRQGVACISKNFKKPDETLISVARLAQMLNVDLYGKKFIRLPVVDRIKFVLEMVESNTDIKNFEQYLSNLLYIDSVFLNEDRHFHNIMLIYNEDENTWKTCPIFDNGAALLSDITKDYPITEPVLKLIDKVKAKPFSSDFKKQCEAMYTICKSSICIDLSLVNIEELLRDKPYSKEILNRVRFILKYLSQQQKAPAKTQISAISF